VGALRFFNRVEPKPAAPSSEPNSPRGLAAFSSESEPPRVVAPQRRSRLATQVLVAIVILQAVPTTLWVIDRVQSRVTAETFSAASAAPFTTATVLLPGSCEAKPTVQSALAAPAPTNGAAAASLDAGRARLVAGHLAVSSPVVMRVFESGRLIGTTEVDSTLLPAGRHDLELVNEAVGYRARRTVVVSPGETTNLRLEPPLGTLNINATPWAEVWIDDERIGETPIGNLQTRIGTRQVTFRHPELGERRATVLVTLTGPARLSMDLRKK
jgi:hypothetical protein